MSGQILFSQRFQNVPRSDPAVLAGGHTGFLGEHFIEITVIRIAAILADGLNGDAGGNLILCFDLRWGGYGEMSVYGCSIIKMHKLQSFF